MSSSIPFRHKQWADPFSSAYEHVEGNIQEKVIMILRLQAHGLKTRTFDVCTTWTPASPHKRPLEHFQ
jgi:hypothetical protein